MTQQIMLKSLTNVRVSLGVLSALRVGFVGKLSVSFAHLVNISFF
jgi:hypothetical protein